METAKHSLIPRTALFAPAARSAPIISPNGNHVVFLAEHKGAQNIWIAPSRNCADARPLTAETISSIRQVWWASDGERLIVLKDPTGSEQTGVFSYNTNSGHWICLSPPGDGECRPVVVRSEIEDEILVEFNDRDPAYFDVWRVNIRTGDKQRIVRNERFTWIHADRFLRPRLAEERCENGFVIFHTAEENGDWRPLIHVPPEDEMLTRPFRIYELADPFDETATRIYAMDCRDRNTAALVTWDLETGAAQQIAEDARADATGLVKDAAAHTAIAWTLSYEKPELRALSANAATDLNAVGEQLNKPFSILDQSADGQIWIIAAETSERPRTFMCHDRSTGQTWPLYDARPALTDAGLCPMQPHIIESRDGLKLVSYLTLPEDRSPGHAMVVLVHGGPWIRDNWGFDFWTQFLANRGYAVLNVNYRGSQGFGKAFLNAGDKEWGGKMFDDVVDGVRWAIDKRIAEPGKIGIMGASFGGYATLVGMTREPDMFACGIDVFGVSNLISFLATIPQHWKVLREMWERRLGDPNDPIDRKMLAARSPINFIDRLRHPVLIAQGATDPRVVKAESENMTQAIEQSGGEVTYLLYPDEGHSFYQIDNELSFFACAEAFLSKHLGGPREAFGGELSRSSLTVPMGATLIPGLAEALESRVSNTENS